MKQLPDRDERRALVLRAGSRQVLWALLLTLIILAGLAFRLGREVGYAISFGVCGGIAVLIAASLLAIRIVDRASSGIVSCLRPRESPSNGDRGSPGKDGSIMKRITRTTDAPQAIGPYSQAVEANGLVFVSGQIPLDPKTGAMADGGIAEQVRQVMENGKAILAAAGCGMEQVVRTTIYLKDLGDFGIVNEVYGRYFPEAPPARATVEVARLPKDARIEIDFVAIRG